jgi:hypothetical protein
MANEALRIEDHVFRIAENQRRLFDYLNERSESWAWNVDLAEGTLVFTDETSNAVLLECPAFLLGTMSDADNSWLWGWANRNVSMPEDARRRFAQLVAYARAEDLDALTADKPGVLSDPTQGMYLAVLAAGALGCFTFYAGRYDGGTAFLAVDRCPEAEALRLEAPARVTVITETIAALPFEHRAAMEAYLGEPLSELGSSAVFSLGAGQAIAEVTFDDKGRMTNLRTALEPGGGAPPE